MTFSPRRASVVLRQTTSLVGLAVVALLAVGCDSSPTEPPAESPEYVLAAGFTSACLYRPLGEVRCWGEKAPQNLPPVSDIKIWYDAGCALRADRQLQCWGISDIYIPDSLGPVEDFDVGLVHACAVVDGGQIRCWNLNPGGLIGRMEPPDDLPPARQVAVGYDHACIIDTTSMVHCWGSGFPSSLNPPEPITDARELDLGRGSSCVLLTSGRVRCWGRGRWVGELVTDGLDDVTSIASGINFTCAMVGQGQIRCWSTDIGGFRQVPRILTEEPVLDLAAGVAAACALRQDLSVICFEDQSLSHPAFDLPR